MDTLKNPPISIVDAFASGPFTGNPAAVVVLDPGPAWPDVRWMQALAMEMNLSETAFVLPTDRPDAFGLRWFTPADEVQLCGHATLAAAHDLWSNRHADPAIPLRFQTLHSGVLVCSPTTSGEIAMDFPAQHAEPTPPPPGLLDTLGLPAGVTPVATAFGPYDWLVELPHPDAVRQAAPDFPALAQFDCRGIALTAATPKPDLSNREGPDRPTDHPTSDLVSRFFAPRLRVAEDPVTGSLHCVLAPYWADRLGHTLRCEQASARGGTLTTAYNPDTQRVTLTGTAITTVVGQLMAGPTGS